MPAAHRSRPRRGPAGRRQAGARHWPYRIVRVSLNLDKPADLRLSEAIDHHRGTMSIATFLREAIWWYVQTTPPGPADLRRDGWEIIDALARLVRQRQRGVRRRRLQNSLRGRRA